MLTLPYICSVLITSACGTAGISIVPGKGVVVIFQLVTHATCIYSLVIYVEGRESRRYFFFPNALSNIYEVVCTSKPQGGELRDIKMQRTVISKE